MRREREEPVTSDGVRVGSVARHTPTQRVAVPVGGALGVGPAWCGIAGVCGPPCRDVGRASPQPVVEDDGGARELGGGQAAVHWAAPRDVACHAGADGVTLVVDSTVSEFSAGRGVAR